MDEIVNEQTEGGFLLSFFYSFRALGREEERKGGEKNW